MILNIIKKLIVIYIYWILLLKFILIIEILYIIEFFKKFCSI